MSPLLLFRTIHLGCADARRTATGRDHVRRSRDATPQRIIGLEGPLLVRTKCAVRGCDRPFVTRTRG